MAALHIHAVKAGRLRKARRLAECLLVALERVVAQNTRLVQRRILQRRAVVGDQRFREALRLRIAAGVGGLHDDHRRIAVFTDAGLTDLIEQLLRRVNVVLVHGKLMRAGTALRHSRHRFIPDQTRATLGKAQIAAAGQLIRRAAQRTIRALHRLESNAVSCLHMTQLKRRKQAAHIAAHGKIDAQRIHFFLNITKRVIAERLMLHRKFLLNR